MNRRRFFVPPELIRDGVAHLPKDQAHHLRHVLRLRANDVVEIFDGRGTGYKGKIEVRGEAVVIHGLKKIGNKESLPPVILAPALIKATKFEWVLQKATELGVREIIPIKTLRSDIRIPEEKIGDRLGRWDRIVIEASKQSRRMSSPKIWAPMDFADFLSLDFPCPAAKVLFWEEAHDPWVPNAETIADGVVLCIGPEGGWEESEVRGAERAGYQTCSLGPQTLRAETAAIVAVSIAQHYLHRAHRASTEYGV